MSPIFVSYIAHI